MPAAKAKATMVDALYVGSSIFQQWQTAAEVWPGRRVENIAVGGTVTTYWLERLEADIRQYRPRVLCYYCGSNDFNADETAAAIAGRTLKTLERVWAIDKGIHIAYHSVIKAPQKQGRWLDVDTVNAALEDHMKDLDQGYYVDLNSVFFDEGGNALAELYVGDQLHLTADAYARMVRQCQPWAAGVLVD
jgi:lysophospholipase L1-like esterase